MVCLATTKKGPKGVGGARIIQLFACNRSRRRLPDREEVDFSFPFIACLATYDMISTQDIYVAEEMVPAPSKASNTVLDEEDEMMKDQCRSNQDHGQSNPGHMPVVER